MNTAPYSAALRRIPAIGVGYLVEDTPEVVGLGTIAGEADPGLVTWEIGSITKVFTGILLAEMARRGEVDLNDPIGEHAPEEVAARLGATDEQPRLVDLATHTAGFPRVPLAWLRRLRNEPDPYSHLTEQDVWDVLTPSTKRPSKAKSRYSNYGMGLLGHLLAHRGGMPYSELIQERVIGPLGLANTGVGVGTPLPGFRKKGKPTPPWTFGALDGAGAIWSTVDDMLRFARAVIEPPTAAWAETMASALTTHHAGRFMSLGLAWQFRREPGASSSDQGVAWHNGGTFGGAAFLAVDVAQRTAIVAFGNRGPRLTSPLDRASWKAFDALESG